MEKNSKIKFIFVSLFFLFIIVGGYILMQKSYSFSLETKDDENKISEKIQNVDIRLDKTKDYIYFSETNRVVDELDIEYKYINFNFDETSGIAKTLNDETDEEKKTLVYDETLEDSAYNKLVGASYKNFVTYEYDNYYSLIVNYYDYAKDTLVTFKKARTYVFDKNNGHILTDDELLNMYELNVNDVKNKVKTYIEDIDLLDVNEKLDAAATVEGMDELHLYINKLGKLTVTVLVKSDQKDYNEDIVLS